MRSRFNSNVDAHILLEDLDSFAQGRTFGLANCNQTCRVEIAFGFSSPLEAFLARGIHDELMLVVEMDEVKNV